MPDVATTQDLLKEAKQEARHLQEALANLKAASRAGRWFLETAYKPAPRPGHAAAPTLHHGYNIWLERADHACALAEEVKDQNTKRLLLEMANRYDEWAALS